MDTRLGTTRCQNCNIEGTPDLNDPKCTLRVMNTGRGIVYGYGCIDAIACYNRQVEAHNVRTVQEKRPSCRYCHVPMSIELYGYIGQTVACSDIQKCNDRIVTQSPYSHRCINDGRPAEHYAVSGPLSKPIRRYLCDECYNPQIIGNTTQCSLCYASCEDVQLAYINGWKCTNIAACNDRIKPQYLGHKSTYRCEQCGEIATQAQQEPGSVGMYTRTRYSCELHSGAMLRCARCDAALPADTPTWRPGPYECPNIAECNERVRNGARYIKTYRCVSCKSDARYRYDGFDLCEKCFDVRSEASKQALRAAEAEASVTIDTVRRSYTFRELEDFAVECVNVGRREGLVTPLLQVLWENGPVVLDLATAAAKGWPLAGTSPGAQILVGDSLTAPPPSMPEFGHPVKPWRDV